MATEQRIVGPFDYLASGIERAFDVISKGRAEKRQRQERLADIDAERQFRARQLADEIALRTSIEEKQMQARFDLANQAAEEAGARQREQIVAQRDLSQMTLEQRTREAAEDRAWREQEADERRRDARLVRAGQLRSEAIKTGVLPTATDFTAVGLTPDEAEQWAVGTMTARQDFEKTPEFLEARRVREAQIRDVESRAAQRADDRPHEEWQRQLMTLDQEESDIRAQIQAGDQDPGLLLRLREIGDWRTRISGYLARRPVTSDGVVIGQHRGVPVTTENVARVQPAGRAGGGAAPRGARRIAPAQADPEEIARHREAIFARARQRIPPSAAEVEFIQRTNVDAQAPQSPREFADTLSPLGRSYLRSLQGGPAMGALERRKLAPAERDAIESFVEEQGGAQPHGRAGAGQAGGRFGAVTGR